MTKTQKTFSGKVRQSVKIAEWNERYRAREQAGDFEARPTPLVIKTAEHLRPGRAIDLACGTGRDALWLAARGWSTTAVDGSEAAIAALRLKADQLGIEVDASVADLTKPEFAIEEGRWDLALMCYYLQRDLFDALKNGVRPGGVVIAIVHTMRPGEEPTISRLRPGELIAHFDGWPILHHYEGASRDPAHRRPVEEVVARRPLD
jgi:tellurite methyltransferase